VRRLFLTVFDLKKELLDKNRLLPELFNQNLFTKKKILGLVLGDLQSDLKFSCLDLASHADESFIESQVKEISENLFSQYFWNRVPDLQDKVTAVLTDQQNWRDFQFFGRKPIGIPVGSHFQGKDLVSQVKRELFDLEMRILKTHSAALNGFFDFINQNRTFTDFEIKAEISKFIKKHGAPKNLFNLEDTTIQFELSKRHKKPRLLLHVCCGPDAGGVISQLKKDFDVHGFWYDPNIQPLEEYNKRLEAFVKVAKIENIPYTVGEYDVERFEKKIRGLEYSLEKGAKCTLCYDMRLERAAHEAALGRFDIYTTTLAISPHKVQSKLKNFGKLFESRFGVPYLARNFLKHEGFKNSVQYTREHDIFRQDYCGCFYSLWEGGQDAQKKAKDWGYLPPNEIDPSQTPHDPNRMRG
jgi:predicted adenine nucleotide alpha hydrolase (AANH) superfamily ATPase